VARWRLTVFVLSTVLILASCGETPPPPSGSPGGSPAASVAEGERAETLIIGFEGGQIASPDIANPFVPARWPMISAGIHQAVFESLFYLNYETGETEPWLAESYEYNDDATELTITIREGVTWSDGEPFTAGDVAFTLNMLKEHPDLVTAAAVETWVDSVEAADDRTVQIALTGSNPRFVLDNLAVQIWGAVVIVPEHIWAEEDPATFTNFDLEAGLPVATGPYRMVSASPTEFVYERRDDWWAAETGFAELPAPRKLIFVEQGPDDRKAVQLGGNQMDAAASMGLGAFKVAQASNPNVIGWFDEPPFAWIDPCPFYFEFNTTVAPWDDPEMRRAVSWAIDRQALADLTNEGAGVPSKWVFPTYGPLEELLAANEDLFEEHQAGLVDPEAAMALFEEKGYERGSDGIYAKDGERLSMQLLMATPEWSISTSYLVQALTAVGIEVQPKLLAIAAYQDAASLGEFDARQGWVCGSVTDPFTTLNAWHQSRAVPIGERTDYDRGAGRWANEEYSAIVDEIAQLEPGDPAIEEKFREALDIYLAETPAFGLYQQVRIVPYNQTYWTNWPTAENNYIHPPNWWMTTHQVLLQIEPAS
jgi:peptide/nickel transport system substrate-binding protein